MATSLNSYAPFGHSMRREGLARDPDLRPAAEPEGEALPRGPPPLPARAAPGWVPPLGWEPDPPRQRYSWEVDRGIQAPSDAPCRAPPRERYSWEVDSACQTEAVGPALQRYYDSIAAESGARIAAAIARASEVEPVSASPPRRPPLFIPASRREGWSGARGSAPAASPAVALAGRPFAVAGHPRRAGQPPAHEVIIVVTTRPLPPDCPLWWAPVRGGRFHLRSTCPGLGAAAAVSRILPTRLLTPCTICVGPAPVE